MTRSVRFVLRRLALTLPVLFVMSVVVFSVVRLVPGDPARTMLGILATPDTVAQINEALGINRDPLTQYVAWIGGILRGDLGYDFLSRVPVSELLAVAIPATLQLSTLTLVIAVAIGVPLGVAGAMKPGWVRRVIESLVVAGTSMPSLWLGFMLVLLFTATLGLLPPSGYVPMSAGLGAHLRYMALPVATLAIGLSTYIARTTMGAVQGSMHAPSIQFLRSAGVSERSLVWRHALRNAGPAILTVVGIQFGALLGGAIVIESIFNVPGVGNLLVTAIARRNYPIIQGAALVIAFFYIAVNLVTDLLIGWADPRIADSKAQ